MNRQDLSTLRARDWVEIRTQSGTTYHGIVTWVGKTRIEVEGPDGFPRMILAHQVVGKRPEGEGR